MKAILLIFCFLNVTTTAFSQALRRTKEVAFYAEKTANGYKLFRLSYDSELPTEYFFDLINTKFVKKYTVSEFEKKY